VTAPVVGEEVTEGVLARWFVDEGEIVEAGQVLCEVETAKAILEVGSPESGVIVSIRVAPGQEFQIEGTVLAVLGQTDDPSALTADRPTPEPPQAGSGPPPASPGALSSNRPDSGDARGAGSSGVPRVSPAIERLAARLGVDLTAVVPSEPHGRITRQDVEQAIRDVPVVRGSSSPRDPVARLHRRTVGRRMAESKREIPHFYVEREIDVGALVTALRNLGLGLTEAIVKATAVTLGAHPGLNGVMEGEEFLPSEEVNVGVAVGSSDGLYVPVIQDPASRPLTELAALITDLATRAREHRLRPEELEGGTFTISNMGMYGVSRFQAIINPPQVAIAAVGTTINRVVLSGEGVAVQPTVAVTLSCDHRAVDGVAAARFLADLALRIEKQHDWLN